MKRFTCIIAAVALSACTDTADPTALGSESVRPEIQRSARGADTVPDRYIVTFNKGVANAPGLARDVAAEHGGRVHHVYDHALKGFSVTLPRPAAAALARNPNVARIEPVLVVRASDIQYSPTWGLDRIDQRNRPYDGMYAYTQTGAGVNVYIVDTGINYSHAEFGGRAYFGFDAMGDGWNGNDCNGHGTHVAGTVGGQVYGVAKAVRLHAVRVLGCNGNGTTDGVLAGIDWLTANAVKPAVANLSLGGGLSIAVDAAVTQAITSGVVVVVSAGNEGDNACYYSPARVPEAITIGASNSADQAPYFSNYGNCIDWFAPGVNITSAWYEHSTQLATISGTSMAAPHTAGVAAMFLEANPFATPQQVRDKLYEATTKYAVAYAYSVNNHLLTTLYTPLPVPNAAPAASFTAGCNLLSCSFFDLSSDSDGVIANWSWSFGDGQGAAVANPSHAYAAAGTYAVTLTVTDDRGATASSTQQITVIGSGSGGGGEEPPPPPSPAEIVLTVTGRTAKGQMLSDLSWTGGGSARVDVIRNGVRITTTDNDGFHTDALPKNASGPFVYQLCEAGTTVCSNEVTR